MSGSRIAVLTQELHRLEDEKMQYSNVSDSQLGPINAAIERIREEIEEEKNKKAKKIQGASKEMDGRIAQQNMARLAQYNTGEHQ